jgi:hypothetical protein
MFVTMWFLFLLGSPLYTVPLILVGVTAFLDLFSVLMAALVAMTYVESGDSFPADDVSDEQ